MGLSITGEPFLLYLSSTLFGQDFFPASKSSLDNDYGNRGKCNWAQ